MIIVKKLNSFQIRFLLWAVLCSTLAACVNRQLQGGAGFEYNPQAKLYVYECGDDYLFIARIEMEKALLLLPSRAVTLRQVEAASGAKYSDGRVTFWSKGEDAVLEVDNQNYRDCKNNPDRATWALG